MAKQRKSAELSITDRFLFTSTGVTWVSQLSQLILLTLALTLGLFQTSFPTPDQIPILNRHVPAEPMHIWSAHIKWVYVKVLILKLLCSTDGLQETKPTSKLFLHTFLLRNQSYMGNWKKTGANRRQLPDLNSLSISGHWPDKNKYQTKASSFCFPL